MNTPQASLAPEPAAVAVCLVIRTGHADCHARFYPSRYQLVLVRAGQEEKVDLGYSGSRLLERLSQDPGTVVSREELMGFAWSDRVVGQGSLNQQIYTLRQVLGDEKAREIIQTLPRRGYMLNPHFLDTQALGADPQPSTNTLPTVPAPLALPGPARTRRHAPWLIGGGALLAGAALIALFAGLLNDTRVPGNDMQVGPATVRYQAADPAESERMNSDTQALVRRMAALSAQPVELIVSRNEDFYEVLCVQSESRAHWLMVHQDQLAALDDTQLRRCLP